MDNYSAVQNLAAGLSRWIRKNHKSYFGHKNHFSVDVDHKFIRAYTVTSSNVHDSNVFEELLALNNSSKDVWADSAYRSQEAIKILKDHGYREHLQRKVARNRKLSKWEQRKRSAKSIFT